MMLAVTLRLPFFSLLTHVLRNLMVMADLHYPPSTGAQSNGSPFFPPFPRRLVARAASLGFDIWAICPPDFVS